MSFSSNVKNEIIAKKYTREHAALSELAAIICFGGKLRKNEGEYTLSLVTENPKIARRIYSLLKGALNVNSTIKINKSGEKTSFYEVALSRYEDIVHVFRSIYLLDAHSELDSFVSFRIDGKLISTKERERAFVCGAFVMGGSVMDPHKTYHLEFTTGRYGITEDFMKLLEGMGIPCKLVMRKSKYVMYYKSSEDIADVLTVLGVVNALMEYHNAKIVKEMRNNINRTINCETANLNKTVDASVEQVKCIQKLMDSGKFDTLPDNLKDIAILRMEYRESPLKELGEMLNPPIGKSGVNHRLRKIMEIANAD